MDDLPKVPTSEASETRLSTEPEKRLSDSTNGASETRPSTEPRKRLSQRILRRLSFGLGLTEAFTAWLAIFTGLLAIETAANVWVLIRTDFDPARDVDCQEQSMDHPDHRTGAKLDR